MPLEIHRSSRLVSDQYFAYGTFRPGEISFLKIEKFVSAAVPSSVFGSLWVRDGLLLLDPDTRNDEVKGSLIQWNVGQAELAKNAIKEMEPKQHYKWGESTVKLDCGACAQADILFGVKPRRGSHAFDVEKWSSWNDPYFSDALEICDELAAAESPRSHSMRSTLKLQMAYLLLWSSIERYTALRYRLDDKVWQRVSQLAKDPQFSETMNLIPVEPREIFRIDRPNEKIKLLAENPDSALEYYYQVRSNLAHRGKGMWKDHAILAKSLAELVAIFRNVIASARSASEQAANSLAQAASRRGCPTGSYEPMF